MALNWVQVTTKVFRYDGEQGSAIYHAGDWLQMRNADMLRYIAEGKVTTPVNVLKQQFDFSKCGVLWRGRDVRLPALEQWDIQQQAATEPRLPWPYTLLAHADATCTAETAALGFLRVTPDGPHGWELAALLYAELPTVAARYPHTAEAVTAVLGTADVLLYDPARVWVRRTPATEGVMAAWQAHTAAGLPEAVALTLALYQSAAQIVTLPPAWVGTLGPGKL